MAPTSDSFTDLPLRFYDDALHQCIDRFGCTPRQFSWSERLTYLRVPRPLWLYIPPFDELWTLFHNLPSLFANGIVVWGHIVQANCRLFAAGNDNNPAEVVYSLDENISLAHLRLQLAALELMALKGTSPGDSELSNIAEYLTDELVRVFGLPVPRSISAHRLCISTTFLIRKHLPKQQVCRSLLPLIVNPIEPHVVLPLPEKYWPDDLVQWWTKPDFCFEEALSQFSDLPAVSTLSESYNDASNAVAADKARQQFEAADVHRERQLQVAHKLEILLERLSREHGD